MDDLVQFVRDRLDEEERVARDAEREMTPGGFSVESLCIHLPPEVQEHNGRHNPARVLREVEAKRALIVDRLAEKHAVVEDCWYSCTAATEQRDGGETCRDDMTGEPCDCGRDNRVARQLRLLALPYADHPDYREEWRP